MSKLIPHEQEILELKKQGYGAKAIANKLSEKHNEKITYNMVRHFVDQNPLLFKKGSMSTNTNNQQNATVLSGIGASMDNLTQLRMIEFLEEQNRKLKRDRDELETSVRKLSNEKTELEIKVKNYDREKELEVEKLKFQFKKDAKSGLNGIADSLNNNPVLSQLLLGVANKLLGSKHDTQPQMSGVGAGSANLSQEQQMYFSVLTQILSPQPADVLMKIVTVVNAFVNNANYQSILNNLFNEIEAAAANPNIVQ